MSQQSRSGTEDLEYSWRALVFSLLWNPEVGSHIGEGMPQQQDK